MIAARRRALLRSLSPISAMRQIYIRWRSCIELQICVRLQKIPDRRTRKGSRTMNHIAVQTSAPTWARPATAAGPGPRRWLILAVVALAQLMVVLDATIVNIALPSAQHAL